MAQKKGGGEGSLLIVDNASDGRSFIHFPEVERGILLTDEVVLVAFSRTSWHNEPVG